MHFRFRLAAVLWASVIFSVLGAPCARAQEFDSLFEKARSLEEQHKDREAVAEYLDVARAQKDNPEAAAEAQRRAMVYSDERYGLTAEEKHDGHGIAQECWKQLYTQFPATKATRAALDFRIQKAVEKGKQDALKELAKIAGDLHGPAPDLAAETLYQSGLFASEKYGGAQDEKNAGEDAAVQLWKQLAADYPNSPAAARLKESTPEAQRGRLVALEERIDKRNAGDWRYQILDVLVKATGKQPWSYSLALVLLAVLVKMITFPMTRKQYKSMAEMQRMQPLVKELQKKFKGAELHQKTMELYKEHKVNPMASCLPVLVMMPFLILVFSSIRLYEYAFAHGTMLWIGSALSLNPGAPLVGPYRLLARSLVEPDIPILILYGLTNYITMKMTPAQDPQQQQSQSMMAVMMSFFLPWMFLSSRWSSAFVFYWTVQNVLTIWQQYELILKPARERKLLGTSTNASGPASTSNGASGSVIEPKPVEPGSPPARVRPRRKGKR